MWGPLAALLKYGKWDPNRGAEGADRKNNEVIRITEGEKAMLKSAVVGGQWPQDRLFKAGLTDHSNCMLCLARGNEVRGSLRHRCVECHVVEERAGVKRPNWISEEWEKLRQHEQHKWEGHRVMDVNSEQDEEVDSWSGSDREDEGGRHIEEGSRLSAPGLGSSLSPFSSWWERAILPLPVRWPAPPPESFTWIIGPKDDLLDADVFIDGSLFDGDLPEVAVVGWAFVITRGDDILGLARGVPPEYVRSILAVEAWGLAMASMLVGTNGRYFTDCKSVKDVARGGRVKATAAGQLHARIWTITFSHTDGDIPEVEWMPSHSEGTGVGTLRIGDGSFLTERQWRFNQLVDQHAKEAAAEARHAPALSHTSTHRWEEDEAG